MFRRAALHRLSRPFIALSRAATPRRAVLLVGLTAVCAGLTAIIWAVSVDGMRPEWGTVLAFILILVAFLGVMGWVQLARNAALAESEPRTVQLVYLPAPPDTIDAELRGMLARHSTQDTTELRRFLNSGGE